MKLLIIHMGLITKPEDTMNVRGIKYANIDNMFEKVFILMPPHPSNKDEVFLLENGIYIFNFHFNKFLSYFNYIKLIIKAFHLKKKYGFDLIHAYNPHLCGFIGVILKKMFSVPLIISVHSDLKTLFNKNLMQYLFNSPWMTNNIEVACFKNADQIWVQAEHMKEYIQNKFSIDTNKFRKIKILIDGKEFSIVKEHKFNYNSSRNLIFMGRLDPQKNVLLLLEAYRKLKEKNHNFKLLIIGDGSQKDLLLDYKERNNLKNVFFLGAMDHNKIRPYLLEADCFVHPGGFGEGFSNTILEAQMSGLPIIVSDVYPEKEFISKNNSLIFRYDDSEDLAQKIEYLFEKPERLQYLSRMSIKTAQSYFAESPFNVLKNLYLHFQCNASV